MGNGQPRSESDSNMQACWKFEGFGLISFVRIKMWKYLLLTALTFYVLSPGVVFVLPSVGPVPSLVLHALLFAVVHKAMHKYVLVK